MKKRSLSSNKNGEEVIQNSKPKEIQEEKLSKNNTEVARGIKRLNLPKHYKKRKKIMVDLRILHTHLKVDANRRVVIDVIDWDIPKSTIKQK